MLIEEEYEICPKCNGSGEGVYDGSRCSKCKGLGELESEQTISEEKKEELEYLILSEQFDQEHIDSFYDL